jgi:amidophosphoribosyltransferase
MSSRTELIAHGLDSEEIATRLGADGLIYQRAEDMRRIIGNLNPALREVESSCFDGHYVTGGVSEKYLSDLAGSRPRC